MFKKNCPCDYEICIGDNSTIPEYRFEARELANVYVRITDKELWRMGIPWGHNRIAAQANSYKIFYVDSDEYPVWIDPDIEDIYDINYIPGAWRMDFLTMEQIMKIDGEIDNNAPNHPAFQLPVKLESQGLQERIYNSRYAKFEGVCHSIFHVPDTFRRLDPVTLLLHNKTVRDAKDIDRMRTIIREQYAKQNINAALASSNKVLEWGRPKGRRYTHKFKDFDDFIKNYKEYPYDF